MNVAIRSPEIDAIVEEQIAYWRAYQSADECLLALGRGAGGGWERVRAVLAAELLRTKDREAW